MYFILFLKILYYTFTLATEVLQITTHYSCKEEQEDLAWILTLTTCVFLNIQDQELKLNYQDYAQSGCVNVYN